MYSSQDWSTKYNRATTLLLAYCLFRSPVGSLSRALCWNRFDNRVMLVVDGVCWEGRKQHLPGKKLCGRDNTNEVLQVLFGEDSKERCRRSPNRVKRNTASSGAVNATRPYSKRPSPSDTEYEIARVRGDALVRCSPRCKQRVVQVPPAKARRPSPAADSPKNTPGLTHPSAAEVSTATHTASTTGDRR